MKNYPTTKTLLLAGLITAFSFNTASALDGAEKQVERMYVDPITGEQKYAKKLLSEMSDTEKALLSNEEYQALKDLEAKLKEQGLEAKDPAASGE